MYRKKKLRIYMEQPMGFEETKVCFFNNHIYGRKQASISWKKTVHKFSTAISYSQSTFEPCVYSKREKGNTTILLLSMWVTFFHSY